MKIDMSARAFITILLLLVYIAAATTGLIIFALTYKYDIDYPERTHPKIECVDGTVLQSDGSCLPQTN